MSFIVFLVRFVEKGPKTAKSGKIRGVLHSSVVIPCSGKGLHNGEGFPRRSVAEKENLDKLRFTTAKLSFAATKGFATA